MIVRAFTGVKFVAVAGSMQYNQPVNIATSIWEKSLMQNNASLKRSIPGLIVPPQLLFTANFISCMHWFLIMADTLASGTPTGVIPDEIRSTIIAYHTVALADMTWRIKIVILLLLVIMAIQHSLHDVPKLLSGTILVSHAPSIFQGVFRIIPMVDGLILNKQSPQVQSEIPRTVHNAHVISAYIAAMMIMLEIAVIILLQSKS